MAFSSSSISKTKAMDVSYFVYEDELSIVIPYPSLETIGFRTLLKPFRIEVKIFQYEIKTWMPFAFRKSFNKVFIISLSGLDLFYFLYSWRTCHFVG